MAEYDMTKYNYDKWNNIKNIIKFHKSEIKKKGKKKFICELYNTMVHKELNFDNPVTFNEKLNVNKIDKRKVRLYSKYADKFKVRKYVKEKIGEEYLIKQYFAKSKIKVKDLEKLPKSFALKTNNGSGSNYIVIDKEKEDLNKVCDYLNDLVKIKYGYIWGEFLYNKMKPKIVAEELMVDDSGRILDDLKCFCFIDNNNVKRKILYFERVVDDERYRIMFDENWKIVDVGCEFAKLDIEISKPKNYKEILDVIDKLSNEFNFVRVDLYLFGDKIYFGELTFVPTAGYLQLDDETNNLWGKYMGNHLK